MQNPIICKLLLVVTLNLVKRFKQNTHAVGLAWIKKGPFAFQPRGLILLIENIHYFVSNFLAFKELV